MENLLFLGVPIFKHIRVVEIFCILERFLASTGVGTVHFHIYLKILKTHLRCLAFFGDSAHSLGEIGNQTKLY